jgi:hypothetical protein
MVAGSDAGSPSYMTTPDAAKTTLRLVEPTD